MSTQIVATLYVKRQERAVRSWIETLESGELDPGGGTVRLGKHGVAINERLMERERELYEEDGCPYNIVENKVFAAEVDRRRALADELFIWKPGETHGA